MWYKLWFLTSSLVLFTLLLIPPFRVHKLVDFNKVAFRQCPGTLWRDKHKLAEMLWFSQFQHQVHWNSSVLHVHIDIKLIQASEGRLCDFPQGEDEADSWERTLSPGEGAHVTHATVLSTWRLHWDCKGFIIVVEWHRSATFKSIKKINEVEFASEGKWPSHLFVSCLSLVHDVIKSIYEPL